MTTIATICARGGSRGVPGKNIRPLLGKPLICHTIEQALASRRIDHVFVSTDDPRIAEIAERAGAQVPGLRPAELATDSAPKVPVIQHLVRTVQATGMNPAVVVDLDPTSPLRSQGDIDTCLELLSPETSCVITAFPAEKNPYFNMIERDAEGRWGLVKSLGETVTSRQAAPAVFSMNASIYVWHEHTLQHGVWGGRIAVHVMPRERSIDIDSEIDFMLVEALMLRRAGT